MVPRAVVIRYSLVAILIGCLALPAAAQTPQALAPAASNLTDYRTVETAITAKIAPVRAAVAGQPGYLGIVAAADKLRRLVVAEVEAGSPAAKAGLQTGDVIVRASGRAFHTDDELREWLRSQAPGATVKLDVERKSRPVGIVATLGATSRPRRLAEERAVLGLLLAEGADEGARVQRVVRGSPADAAGLAPGDLVVKVDGAPVTEALRLDDSVGEKEPGQEMVLTVRRSGQDVDIKVTLAAAPPANNQADPGNDRRPRFTRDVYRLAVVPIEYPDVKHNPEIKTSDWEASLYSKGTYSGKTNVTGQPVFGSLNDFYQELSCGMLRVEGKVFDWVQVGKNRAEYSQGAGRNVVRTALLTEALDKLQARDGTNALEGYDGIMFLYAGGRVPTNRGGIYWPHSSTVAHRGKRWAYLI